LSTLVEQTAARTIGTVESVAPDEIRVLLDLDAPQAIALNSGHLQRFPRINSFVLIPNEVGALVGIVAWLGIERSPYPKRPGLKDFGLVDLPFPLRKMTLVPLGTLLGREPNGESRFELRRGVMSFPSVGDPVLLPARDEQRALVEGRNEDLRVEVGTSPLVSEAPVTVDPDKLFGRHLAVLGNTGSGKSCSVAGLVRWSLEAAQRAREPAGRSATPNARFIVLDPNGEYRTTFSDLDARVFQVKPESKDVGALRVPAWMWSGHEWAAFAQAAPGTQRPLLLQALRNLRAGGSLEVGPSIALARQVRGYQAQLQEKLAQGPAGYSGGFPAKMNCGSLLENLAGAVEHYRGLVTEATEEIDELISSTRDLARERSFTFADGGTGYKDFNETDLLGVVERTGAVLSQLPEVSAAGGASEDAPIPFDTDQMPGHLEVLATSADFASSAAFVATLILRVRSMLADARLAPIVAPDEHTSFEQWLIDYMGATDASDGADRRPRSVDGPGRRAAHRHRRRRPRGVRGVAALPQGLRGGTADRLGSGGGAFLRPTASRRRAGVLDSGADVPGDFRADRARGAEVRPGPVALLTAPV
jgi:hypothetical protein